MSNQTAANAAIGFGGTILAVITPQNAAIFAGVSSGLWMCTQIFFSIYDRCKKPKPPIGN